MIPLLVYINFTLFMRGALPFSKKMYPSLVRYGTNINFKYLILFPNLRICVGTFVAYPHRFRINLLPTKKVATFLSPCS